MNTTTRLTAHLPAYDRTKLTPGIVHIGLGNFHRAHMAVYLDDLFAMGQGMDFASFCKHYQIRDIMLQILPALDVDKEARLKLMNGELAELQQGLLNAPRQHRSKLSRLVQRLDMVISRARDEL